jgi:hypothetical protein
MALQATTSMVGYSLSHEPARMIRGKRSFEQTMEILTSERYNIRRPKCNSHILSGPKPSFLTLLIFQFHDASHSFTFTLHKATNHRWPDWHQVDWVDYFMIPGVVSLPYRTCHCPVQPYRIRHEIQRSDRACMHKVQDRHCKAWPVQQRRCPCSSGLSILQKPSGYHAVINLSIYPSIYLSIYLSIHLSIYPTIYLRIFLSIYLSSLI